MAEGQCCTWQDENHTEKARLLITVWGRNVVYMEGKRTGGIKEYTVFHGKCDHATQSSAISYGARLLEAFSSKERRVENSASRVEPHEKVIASADPAG